MRITVHRGTDQIGGCVTEYEYKGWRLFVDYGEQLPGAPATDKVLEIEGLTCGDVSHSALLITHYHGDHIGKIAELPRELPIFMGKIANEISLELSEHLSSVREDHCKIAERLSSVETFNPGEQFEFGDFKIMPVIIDHSAFDAYAFRIETGGLSVFHTGDFRTHGFRSGKLPQVIEKFIGKVDYMVCEATNVNRPDAAALPEYELKRKFQDAFRLNKYNVVYLSSTNIDRLFALYHASLRAGRPFYVDVYQKRMMDIVAGRDSIWGKSSLYRYKAGREPIMLQYEDGEFRINEKFKAFLSEHGYVLIARSNDRFDNLIKQMPSEGRKTYFSMWEGYVNKNYKAYNPSLAKSLSDGYIPLHTSGHCDMQSMENLIGMLRPKTIIPIHTDSPKKFAELFSDKWPVMLLKDGETFAPIHDPGFDNLTANVIAFEQPDEDVEAVENPDNLPWWGIDEKCIGEFKKEDDAEFALRHVVYAPDRVLAYTVEGNEDMAPWIVKAYSPDFKLFSQYTHGGHFPGENNFQQECGFKQGDKILAAVFPVYRVIVPCEVVGPVTEEFMKEQFENDELYPYDTYEEYASKLQDWDWDTVLVRPLVRLKTEYQEMAKLIDAQRIYLFPCRNPNSKNDNSASL